MTLLHERICHAAKIPFGAAAMNFTDQQEAIIAGFAAGKSFAVQARAGTGKTSTIEAAYRKSLRQGLYVAFNRKNADEAKARMPESTTSRTMNALGHKAWWQYTRKKLEVNPQKLSDLLYKVPGGARLDRQEKNDILALTRAARVTGLPPGIGPTKKPTDADWTLAAEQADIENWEDLAEVSYALLQLSTKEALMGQIDFDDQIYCPILFQAPFERYDCVTVDEAQDLSSLQHTMIQRLLAPKSQLVIVGDPAQAIYGFRGASTNSFQELQDAFSLPVLPLSRSFRCPTAVVREAQKYVPDIEAASDFAGEVKEGLPELADKNTILSRTNAPLIALAMKAIRQRKPITYLGRDFTSGLLSLHKKASTPEKLAVWYEQEVKKNPRRKKALEDKLASMLELHKSGIPVEIAIKDLMAAAKAGQGTVLSTIHKAKGLEWDQVTYLQYAKEWDGEQEVNIKYVGVTRAKRTLILHMEE